jgi:hypothetical protein
VLGTGKLQQFQGWSESSYSSSPAIPHASSCSLPASLPTDSAGNPPPLLSFHNGTVPENDRKFNLYRLASSQNVEIVSSSSLMYALLAKKICELYLKQEKCNQHIKTIQYFPCALYR